MELFAKSPKVNCDIIVFNTHREHIMYIFYIILDHMPDVQNYSHPEVYGLDGTKNFYIDTKDSVTLGVW